MNRVLATGRLATDPQVKRHGDDVVVCQMRLAIARRRDERDQGPVFVDLVAFGRLATVCGEHLERGSRVAVSARLDLSQWTDPQGGKRSRHQLIAQEVEFLDRPPGWTPKGADASPAQPASPVAVPIGADVPVPAAQVGGYEALAS